MYPLAQIQNYLPVAPNQKGYYNIWFGTSPIRLAAFYDGGFVNVNEWDFGLSDYNDNFGVGIRMNINGSPIRLDFGFPFQTADHNDDSMQFHFSFGTRF